MRILATFFLVFNSTMLIAQIEKEYLIGTWEGYKKDLRNGETGENYTPDGKPYQNSTVFKLRTDSTGIEFDNDQEFTFSIDENNLRIGNRFYVIQKLTRTELVIIEYDKYVPDDPMAVRLYFRKREEN